MTNVRCWTLLGSFLSLMDICSLQSTQHLVRTRLKHLLEGFVMDSSWNVWKEGWFRAVPRVIGTADLHHDQLVRMANHGTRRAAVSECILRQSLLRATCGTPFVCAAILGSYALHHALPPSARSRWVPGDVDLFIRNNRATTGTLRRCVVAWLQSMHHMGFVGDHAVRLTKSSVHRAYPPSPMFRFAQAEYAGEDDIATHRDRLSAMVDEFNVLLSSTDSFASVWELAVDAALKDLIHDMFNLDYNRHVLNFDITAVGTPVKTMSFILCTSR